MKYSTITFSVLLFTNVIVSQDMNIETKSVSIDNLISFIVDTIERKAEDSELPTNNITFLLQTPVDDLITEDKVILNQAFKLISKRLTEEDLTCTGFNGIALKQTSPKELKSILYTIENLKSSVKEFHQDGIELAYQYAKENFMENSINTVILIRNPKASNIEQVAVQNELASKKNTNVILISAIALLPEIISVIKD